MRPAPLGPDPNNWPNQPTWQQSAWHASDDGRARPNRLSPRGLHRPLFVDFGSAGGMCGTRYHMLFARVPQYEDHSRAATKRCGRAVFRRSGRMFPRSHRGPSLTKNGRHPDGCRPLRHEPLALYGVGFFFTRSRPTGSSVADAGAGLRFSLAEAGLLFAVGVGGSGVTSTFATAANTCFVSRLT